MRVAVYSAGAINEQAFGGPGLLRWIQMMTHAIQTFASNHVNIVFISEVSAKHRPHVLESKPDGWTAATTGEFVTLASPEYQIISKSRQRVFPHDDASVKKKWRDFQQAPQW